MMRDEYSGRSRPGFQARLYRPGYIGLLLALALVFTLEAAGQTQPEALTVAIEPVVVVAEFPQASAFVTVLDAAGRPVAGLTEANFQVIEDGLALPDSMVTVESETAPQTAFVLALDLSLDEAGDLAPIQQAALAFIETLGPRDQLTLLVYHDEVEILFQGPVEDKAALKQMITGLEETGGHTAFYEALHQAEAAFEPHSAVHPARRAIVTVTNVGNNVSSAAANEARAAIEAENRVPIHIISYGRRADVEQLKALLGKTKGQLISLSDAGALPPALQQVGRRLRQGYKVSFQPNRNLDGSHRHNITVRVAGPRGQSGRAQAGVDLAFEEVKVVLTGVRNLHLGQTLVVTAAIDSPVLVDSVSYQVDAGPAFVTRQPPYQFTWASVNIEPGDHTLTVTVTDQTGRSAVNRTTFTVFQMIAPLAKVDWGEAVTLEAEVDQPALVAGVEFWLAGPLENERIGRVTGSPYRLIFTPDNPAYPPLPAISEQYTIIARVAYKQPGQPVIEDKFALEFLKPPRTAEPIIPAWLWRSMSGTCLAGAYLLVLPLLATVWRRNRRRQIESLLIPCHLTLRNKGNAAVSFRLSALAAVGAESLQFQFRESQAPRPGPYRCHPNGTTGPPAGAARRPEPVPENKPVSGPPVNPPVTNGAARLSQKRAAGSQAAAQAGGLGDMVIGVLDGLSGIPYLGRPFRPIVGGIRQTKSEAGRAARMPGQVAQAVSRTTQHLPGSHNSAAVAAAPAPGHRAVATDQGSRPPEPDWPETAAPSVAPARPDPLPAPPGPGPDRPAPGEAVPSLDPEPAVETSAWATTAFLETSPVEPGRKLAVALQVRPASAPYQTRRYRFQVTAGPAGPVDEPDPLPEKSSDEQVEIAGLSRWYHPLWFWTPALLGLGGATVFWLTLLFYTAG